VKTHCPIAQLARLVDFLDGLCARATVEELDEQLTSLNVTTRDVSEFLHFSKSRYLRNLVCDGQYYHLLVMCWRSGQRSPIHNHAGSTCGLRVLTGTATETVFEPTPCSLLKAVRSHDMVAPEVVVTQDADIHQISNLQAEGSDLVTLHIYSPPLLRMDTFSLTDKSVGEFRPMVDEHLHGSGI